MNVSVIVVSQDRTTALARTLTALAQLDPCAFELIVICDQTSMAMVLNRPDAAQIKLQNCAVANVSRARNMGLALAAGEIVAFIDDDAVPEPTWLPRLVAPFADPEVTTTGGYVRGRNGVSFQWQASSVDTTGRRVFRNPDDPLPEGEVWHTEGTNMAFRTATLKSIGGFDEAFHYFLDETDVNMRMPGRTKIVPDAEVHHGFAASKRRRSDRVPRSLFDIGASSAHFLKMHNKHAITETGAEIRRNQLRRALRHMQTGTIEPRDVRRLMTSFDAGFRDGLIRVSERQRFRSQPPDFLPFRTKPLGAKCVFSGPWSRRKALKLEARAAALAGLRPTLILFSPDARYLQVQFGRDGVWYHIGGQFGRGLRQEPLLRWAQSNARIMAERARTATIRGLPSSQSTHYSRRIMHRGTT